MQLFHFDNDGLLCGKSTARLDALESEQQGRMVYLHPARSTDIAPPDLAEKQAARWTGDAWEVVADHRGEVRFDFRTPVQITGVGDPAADGLTVEPAPPTLDEAKAAKVAELRAACAAHITGGFVSEALGEPHTYPSATTDQQNLAASVLASLLPGLPADWSTPFWCLNADGAWSFAPHNAAQIQRVGADGKAFVVAAQTELNALAEQVDAAPSVEAVAAITA